MAVASSVDGENDFAKTLDGMKRGKDGNQVN